MFSRTERRTARESEANTDPPPLIPPPIPSHPHPHSIPPHPRQAAAKRLEPPRSLLFTPNKNFETLVTQSGGVLRFERPHRERGELLCPIVYLCFVGGGAPHGYRHSSVCSE